MPLSFEMRQAALRDAENRLKEDMAREHGSPFIAHHDLPSPLRQAAGSALITEVAGDLDTFVNYFIKEYPHFALWTVGTAVARGYNAEDHYPVYPPIAECLGVLEIPANRREVFNNSFKAACASLGLMLPTWSSLAGDWVADYLFQAGVSTGQIHHLVHAFQSAERTLGLPSLDDTAEINSWEDAAMGFIQGGLRRLPEIVLDDSTGYHAAAFLRLRTGATPTTEFEHLLLEAISSSGQQGRAAPPPFLTFGNAELHIANPARGLPITVEIGPHGMQLEPGESHIIPPPWPSSARWCPSAQVGQWKSLPIFSDQRGSLLVFDGDSGRHKGQVTVAPSNGQHVPAGSIAILSTQQFEANGESAYPLGDRAYALFLDVSASLLLRHGDITIMADVDARPRLEVDGTKIARNADGWLLAAPTIVRLRGDLGGLGDRLETKVEHPAMGESRRTPVLRMPDGDLAAPLDQLPQDGHFGMARISVHAKNQNRALYRYRFWYWPSLRELCDDGVFDAKLIPPNVAHASLEHIHLGSDGRLHMSGDAPYLRARLAFAVDESIISFSFPPPGVSMFVRTSAGEETAIAIGSRLEITQDRLASHVVIRCSDQSAAIDCKGEIISDPFDKFGLWHRSFAALSTPGPNDLVRLLPRGNEEEAHELFRVGPNPEQLQTTTPTSRSSDSDRQSRFEKLIAIKATPAGTPTSGFTAMVVTGDRDGRVGYGTGTGNAPAVAIRKATQRSRLAMVTVTRHRNTIPHHVEGNFRDAYVVLEPAAPGTGIAIAHPVRAVLDGAGISDVRGEARGSQSAMDLTRAAFAALGMFENHHESSAEHRTRGKLW